MTRADIPRGFARPWQPTLARVGAVLLTVAVGIYAASTVARALGDGGASTFWDGWVFNAIAVTAAALVTFRAIACPVERRVWALLAGALVAQAVAGTAYSAAAAGIAEPVSSTLSGVGMLSFLLVYAAVITRVRQAVARVGRSVWLDGLIAALGMGTLAAAFLVQPVVDATAADAGTVARQLLGPLAELVLLGMMAWAVVVLRGRADRSWWLLGLSGVAYAVADIAFSLGEAAGTYQTGGVLDVGFPAGAALIAIAAVEPSSVTTRLERLADRALLAVPAVATAAAVGVLLVAHGGQHPWFVPGLAVATLGAASLRTALAFRELRVLSESRRLATTDDLTGLANRRLLLERLDALLRAGERPVTLLLVDLDGFKEVNDSLGHDVGDELLRHVGPRLQGIAGPRDTVARLGGDEFAVLLDGLGHPGPASRTADRLHEALDAPVALDGIALQLVASVGVAMAPLHGTDAGELLRSADVAMYQAKARRSRTQLYDPAGDQGGRDRLRLVGELRQAILDGQLLVHYQPVVCVRGGACDHVEALARWQHPTLGLVPPAVFLPLAEQAGLMRQLTLVVVDTALRDCATLRRDGSRLPVAVNLAASTLSDDQLASRIAALLRRHGLPGAALQCEITEDALAADPASLRTLAVLRALDVRLAIDDYGAGYSSLRHLRDLQVDELKLDRSFVTGLGGDATMCAIVRTTVDLAHALGLRMVAEGVETARDWLELPAQGCDLAQGYHIARPMPFEQLRAWLVARGAAEAA